MNKILFRGWLASLLFATAGANFVSAAEIPATAKPAAVPAGAPVPAVSASVARQRAPWQKRLTLGPGDVLNLSLFEIPDTTRNEVPIGPDGRLTFLQARDVPVSGLTIDELRAKLEEILGKFYQNPRAIVTPVAFHSKKYFVIGAVANSGVYTFDRPLTVIEAVARAGGAETGISGERTVEMVDLPHSFLVRNGQRLPVDFERLFQHGDLSQNVPLEPEDYLYFASAQGNEIYVLGEVLAPGVLAFSPNPTVLNAIASRGGFTTRSFRSRVLVVRGSLNNPQTFVVDTSAILAGKAPDFKLQYKDIVYISQSPWIIATEVVDLAARAFVQSMTVTATGIHIRPIITTPLFR
jgi:protein involved in polysaccharide export with SLBB domain